MIRDLLPYQKRWVEDPVALKVIEKSRRIGISWAEAYAAVIHAAAGRGNVYYQSYSQEMTRTFIDDCAEWAGYLQQGAAAAGEALLDDGANAVQAFRVHLASGKDIYAMPASPRIFRSKGKPGDVAVIDEAAFLDDLEETLKAALAFATWGGYCRVISTHNGEGSAFASLLRDIRDGVRDGSAHRVTFADAVADGLYQRICSVSGQHWSPEAEARWIAGIRQTFQRHAGEELDCVPAAGSGAWLPWGTIRDCEDDLAGDPTAFTGGHTWIGIDVARRRDLWVACVIEQVGDVFWLRDLRAKRNIPFSQQRDIVRQLVSAYRPLRVAVDQTGMGEAVVEQLADDHGSMTVEGVLMTGPARLDVATALREVVEDKRLRIPDDDALRADLHAIRAEVGPTGAARLVAERSTTDGHADRFWALALAVAAARSTTGPFEAWTDDRRFAAFDVPSGFGGAHGAGHTIDYELGVVHSPLSAMGRW